MSFRKFPDGSTLGGVRRSVALCALLSMPGVARGQSPRAANPERPTFATHAYTVAPGFVELEQGLSARGVGSLREATTWDVNLKVGVAPRVQVAFFGPLYARGRGGGGVGDLGMALKLRNDVSNRAALAA